MKRDGEGDVAVREAKVSVLRFSDNSTMSSAPDHVPYRVLWATVDSDGTLVTGSGMTVERTDVGRYFLEFDTPFDFPPTVVATPRGAIGKVAGIPGLTHLNTSVGITDPDGSFVDWSFSVIVVGAK